MVTQDTLHSRYPGQLTPLERNEVTGALGGGNSIELIAGITATTLSILGLAGLAPHGMLAAATVVAGASMFTEGVVLAAVFLKIEGHASHPEKLASHGGFILQAIGGAVGIVLGVLAYGDVSPRVLIPVSALVMGASLLVSGSAHADLDWSKFKSSTNHRLRRALDQVVRNAVGVRSMVGMGAAILGIVALSGTRPVVTLSLVAMLLIGAALLVGGSALIGRLAVLSRPR